MKRSISAALIVVLGLVLCLPSEAQRTELTAPTPTKGEVAGFAIGVVAAGAAVVIVAVVVIKKSKEKTITGCVSFASSGMFLTGENDKRVYTLLGDTSGVKPGERMTLHGKKVKTSAGNPRALEVTRVRKDFGVCQP